MGAPFGEITAEGLKFCEPSSAGLKASCQPHHVLTKLVEGSLTYLLGSTLSPASAGSAGDATPGVGCEKIIGLPSSGCEHKRSNLCDSASRVKLVSSG